MKQADAPKAYAVYHCNSGFLGPLVLKWRNTSPLLTNALGLQVLLVHPLEGGNVHTNRGILDQGTK